MMKEVKIYIDERIDVIQEIKNVIESFKENVVKGLKSSEFGGVDIKYIDNKKEADLSIVRFIRKGDAEGKYILVVEKVLNASHLESIAEHDVIGVIFSDHLKSEYEEKGRLEALLKKAIREILMKGETDEAKFSKKVTWKFKADRESEIKEASLFLDPSMRNLKIKIRRIVNDVRNNWYEIFKEFQGYFRKILQNVGNFKWDEVKNIVERKNLDSILRNLRGRISTFPSVLLLGPTGSGKTFLANLIYQKIFDTKDDVPRISLNVYGKDIIGSVLFGSKEGAYTDARSEPGYILSNVGRAIFIDEIAELSPDDQAKLLTYMDSLKINPIGLSGFEIPAPTMIIAATNRDIIKEIEKGNFRRDLFYRFRWKVKVPPLSERKEDMRFLISFVLVTRLQRRGLDPEEYKISYRAIEKLERRNYPGNFRELEDVIENAIEKMLEDGRNVILSSDIE